MAVASIDATAICVFMTLLKIVIPFSFFQKMKLVGLKAILL